MVSFIFILSHAHHLLASHSLVCFPGETMINQPLIDVNCPVPLTPYRLESIRIHFSKRVSIWIQLRFRPNTEIVEQIRILKISI